MPSVARCDECRQLFEIPEDQVKPEEVEQVQHSSIMPVRKVYLCPGCRQGAYVRGQPPAPPAPAPTPEAEEAPQEEPPEEQPQA